jgi:hypothetical protein
MICQFTAELDYTKAQKRHWFLSFPIFERLIKNGESPFGI